MGFVMFLWVVQSVYFALAQLDFSGLEHIEI